MYISQSLKIGNWVFIENRDGDGRYIKVHSIDTKGINLFVSNAGYEYEALFEETDKYDWFWVEPIKLSPEILEKCELEFDGDKWFSTDIGFIEICEDGFILPDSDGENSLGYVLKYLHQFQNLFFALSGKELPISL